MIKDNVKLVNLQIWENFVSSAYNNVILCFLNSVSLAHDTLVKNHNIWFRYMHKYPGTQVLKSDSNDRS